MLQFPGDIKIKTEGTNIELNDFHTINVESVVNNSVNFCEMVPTTYIIHHVIANTRLNFHMTNIIQIIEYSI